MDNVLCVCMSDQIVGFSFYPRNQILRSRELSNTRGDHDANISNANTVGSPSQWFLEFQRLSHQWQKLRKQNLKSEPKNIYIPGDVRPAEREQGAQRRQPPEYSRRRLVFTIAMAGIAVLLGSLFFQKTMEPGPVI
ncbi:hypothetical protein V6N11_053366 [Hibiscus sabdariffa]|uniref:Uncharacterized protein n=1 Tax=Hibiscus sabdariffa TaxID=183260 RepID=A0ABR2UDH7_9ROSI